MTNARELLNIIKTELSPVGYLRSLNMEPFTWQQEALDPTVRRLLLMCARQAGKSTVVAGKACWTAKNFPYSVTLIIAPTERQSKEVMKKIEIFFSLDQTVHLKTDSTFEKQLEENLSRIVALPGSEKTVRGYSAPRMIIIDEAAYVLDETYRAVRPMMTDADTELVMMSTPNGKRGFFYNAWQSSGPWKKIIVRAPADIREGQLTEPLESEERYAQRMREQGIHGYYSPRHKMHEMQEELGEIGELSFREEYLLEFIDEAGSLFPSVYIEAARKEVETLYGVSNRKRIDCLEI